MKIAYFEIQNFRKLKSCRIELGSKETVFVGANNSGKTSAIDALILFLKKERRTDISTTDFTLSHWKNINKIGQNWIQAKEEEELNFEVNQWYPYLPTVDVWINVKPTEIHYVSHLIPTLSWEAGELGVRLILEPKNIENLYKDFIQSYSAATETKESTKKNLRLWPNSLSNFIEKKLSQYFAINAYLLDPKLCINPEDGVAKPQILSDTAMSIGGDPFFDLFKIDIINAQRGFTDANTTEYSGGVVSTLSSQLRAYYDKHLNPTELPTPEDLEALTALESAREVFDDKLKSSFSVAITELEGLGYPGFSDPHITLSSELKMLDGLNHESAVQFNVLEKNGGLEPISLPEKFNGLGYQNLISMVFKLIRFRDDWMKIGKASKKSEIEEKITEPLHIVLIEEPEAHLHAQVQQVFIRKAYKVLRNHDNLRNSDKLSTQLIVSTHSSHIAHETDFSCLRYFRRKSATEKFDVPSSTVVNLSKTFGEETTTSKFAKRYLKTTHCDLFFADAVILVEGPAERMLIPHFISKHEFLNSRYITILEIGGSHAHRLKPLIEDLGLITLIITDIDSINESTTSKIQPKRDVTYRSGNTTLKDWIPKENNIVKLYELSEAKKISDNQLLRIAYQCPINIDYKDKKDEEVFPYTFEDALVFSNLTLFENLESSTGLMKKMHLALTEDDAIKASTKMFDALEKGKKAEMALELLYLEKDSINSPKYIEEGIIWLENILRNKDYDYILNSEAEEKSK
ncbi:ATP-dependent nuclease [Spirochaeta dissipatitropha]